MTFLSLAYDHEKEPLSWLDRSLSLANQSIAPMDESSSMYRARSQRRPSAASLLSVKTASSSQTDRARVRRASVRDILSKSITLVTIRRRISSARRELAAVLRSSIPAPLHQQVKILDDLLDLTRDEQPNRLRRAALRLIQTSFEQIVKDVFTMATRRQFIAALSELCSEELPYTHRREGLILFNYLVGAGASLHSKDLALEHEDCRAILKMMKSTGHVSLKLAACAYLWLSFRTSRQRVHNPISEAELRDISIILIDLSQYPFPLNTRRDALDWLWRFESTQSSGISDDERRDVWTSIFEICGYMESNGSLYNNNAKFRKVDQENYLSGLRHVWLFSIISSWTIDTKDEKILRKIGGDLLGVLDVAYSYEICTRVFELIVLFANLPHWKDMYDEETWRKTSDRFTSFCLRDTVRVDKAKVFRYATTWLGTVLEGDGHSRELMKRRSIPGIRNGKVVIVSQPLQIFPEGTQLCEIRDSVNSVEAVLENLSVFMLPEESMLIRKDQQIILYERICNYAKFEEMRFITMQAMYGWLTVREWILCIGFAKVLPEVAIEYL